MLRLSQQCNKYFILIFLIIIFSFEVDALEIGASPPILEYNVRVGQEECVNLNIFSDKSTYFDVEDEWNAYSDGKDIQEYDSKAREVNIILKYDSEIYVRGNKTTEVCFLGAENGLYNGILLIKPKNKNSAIGVWIQASVGNGLSNLQKDNFQNEESIITGKVINEGKNNNILLISIAFFDILLVFTLVLLLIVMNRKKRRDL